MENRLEGKHIVIGVTGSIAAYKIATLCSMLKKAKANVTVIMTKNATNFVHPLTFETLTANRCLTDTFDRNFRYDVEHVELAKQADAFLVAPASANVIAKIAHGIADDMLTTTFLAATCPKIIAPAMNMRMWTNPITQDNMETLRHYGMTVIRPQTGYLACGDTGEGKMPEPETLYAYLLDAVTNKDLAGKKVLVTAGPTREAIDPVRFISNHSTGKMGYAVAAVAAARGAEVILVSGPTVLAQPLNVSRVDITSADQMAEAVFAEAKKADIIVMAAAVADYRPKEVAPEKMKKKDGDLSIPLSRTTDILATLGENKRDGQILCGFAMESENLIDNAKKKLAAKHLDMIVANNIRTEGAGFGTDTNVVTIIDENGQKALDIMSKEALADEILNVILTKMV